MTQAFSDDFARPDLDAEICVFEVFGDALQGQTAAVGMGVHPFRDPAITDEFAAERVALDVTECHVYAADWRQGRVDFLIDGEHVKSVEQAPDYPMQMMVAVFDFPAHAAASAHPDHVPELAVDFIRAARERQLRLGRSESEAPRRPLSWIGVAISDAKAGRWVDFSATVLPRGLYASPRQDSGTGTGPDTLLPSRR